jgi:hypothetical protein
MSVVQGVGSVGWGHWPFWNLLNAQGDSDSFYEFAELHRPYDGLLGSCASDNMTKDTVEV